MGSVHKGKGVKTNQGKDFKKGVNRTMPDGHESDSGSKDAELCKAAAGLNSPKKGGLPGV